MPQVELTTQPQIETDLRKQLRLARIRLRLALLTMAIVPMALSLVLFKAVLDARYGTIALGIVAAMIGVTLFSVLLTVWMTRRIVQPVGLAPLTVDARASNQGGQQDSMRDALTGLGNHRAFQEELDRELDWYSRYNVPVALMLIDMDDTKLVNDASGHAAGDEMLREMARMITDVARYADRAFRVGGDEFALLMPHTNADGAMAVGRRLLERAIEPRASGRPMPFSGGISACPEHTTDRTLLYAQADAALLWCKRHGRAAVDIYQPSRDQKASEAASDETSTLIARIVNERLIKPAYQPIVDLVSGRVVGFEGLSRPLPNTGFDNPGTMFAAAESAGRTVELDLACLQVVVAGARAMPDDQILTINISPRTIEAPHFSTDALIAILARHNIEPGRVVVELTERERVEDMTRLKVVLAEMKRTGLRLLSQFRFDIVKIDLSLVQDGAEFDSSRAVLKSLRDLAGRWGASVIAEGLETAEQLRVVRELGMGAGQGYLLAMPMPEPNLTSVDLASLEAGGSILDSRLPQPRQAPDSVRTQGAYYSN